jgi:hypothetical protein
MIAHLNTDMLYTKALTDAIPFFEWYSWIESTIQKEVFSQLRKFKKGGKDQPKKDDPVARKDSITKKRRQSKLVKPKEEQKTQVRALVNKYSYKFDSAADSAKAEVAKKNASSFQTN